MTSTAPEQQAELSFGELSRKNLKRCNASFHPHAEWSPCEWATAAAGEVGEACNLIKKLRRGDSIGVSAIADELADAVIYLDLLAQRLEINLGEAVRDKFNTVSVRIGSEVRL